MNKTLAWTTVINSNARTGLKRAVTHFGVTYQLEKDGRNWYASRWTRDHQGVVDMLAEGVSFARARKAAIDDYNTYGGR